MGVSNAFGDKILSAKFAKSDLGVWGDCCVSSGGSSDFILEGVKFPEDDIFRLPGRSQINITHLHDPPTHLLHWLHSHSFVRATVFSFVSWSAAVYPVSSDSLSIWVCLLWFENFIELSCFQIVLSATHSNASPNRSAGEGVDRYWSSNTDTFTTNIDHLRVSLIRTISLQNGVQEDSYLTQTDLYQSASAAWRFWLREWRWVGDEWG